MATLYTVHAFGLCPAASVAEVNAHIAQMEVPDAKAVGFTTYGPEAFCQPCNDDGSLKEPSHFVCHWTMTQAQWDQISQDSKLQAFGVQWDAGRGKLGDRDGEGKEIQRAKQFLDASALKFQAIVVEGRR